MPAPLLAYLYPATLFAATPSGDGGGSWLDLTPANIADVQTEPDHSTFIHFNPVLGLVFEADYGLSFPPSLVAINWVKVYAWAWCRSFNAVSVDHLLQAVLKPNGGARYESPAQTVVGTRNNQG